MDLSIIYQIRNKKIWWVDVVFYFVISLLIAAVICYFIFSLKIYFQKKTISDLDAAMLTVGTDEQKLAEQQIFEYKGKIEDFAKLIAGHQLSLNIFGFIEEQTLPSVWFNKFSVNEKDSNISLTGETDNTETVARQTLAFEESEYTKKVTLLDSSVGDKGRINFNFNLLLDPKIFISFPKK